MDLLSAMTKNRVVISGIGVISPNGIGQLQFLNSLQLGKSGISHIEELESLNFACQLGGIPVIPSSILEDSFSELELRSLKSEGLVYGILAAKEAWSDARLSDKPEKVDWDTGCLFGTGLLGMNVIRDAIYTVDQGKVKKLGSRMVDQTMGSGVSAHLGGLFGLGNKVSANSSACSTGSEAVYEGFELIRNGRARRMVVGSCDGTGPYVWGGFDSMRVLQRKMNDRPQEAMRPMSASAGGFVPGGGAACLILERLEDALERGSSIYAEIVGGAVNSGGHRNGGTMTAPNPEGVQRCIVQAFSDAAISPQDIDLINGHLTATMGDPLEVENWTVALKRKGDEFPLIQSTKSMTGHCLSSAGAIETAACALQLKHQFVHPSINCEDVHPRIEQLISNSSIPRQSSKRKLNIVVNASFGFGDVNSNIVLKRYDG